MLKLKAQRTRHRHILRLIISIHSRLAWRSTSRIAPFKHTLMQHIKNKLIYLTKMFQSVQWKLLKQLIDPIGSGWWNLHPLRIIFSLSSDISTDEMKFQSSTVQQITLYFIDNTYIYLFYKKKKKTPNSCSLNYNNK